MKNISVETIKIIAKKTIWVLQNDNEWIAVDLVGNKISSEKYQDMLMKKLRVFASDETNNILAIAIVSDPKHRKPKKNKPLVPLRPR